MRGGRETQIIMEGSKGQVTLSELIPTDVASQINEIGPSSRALASRALAYLRVTRNARSQCHCPCGGDYGGGDVTGVTRRDPRDAVVSARQDRSPRTLSRPLFHPFLSAFSHLSSDHAYRRIRLPFQTPPYWRFRCREGMRFLRC